MKRSARTFSISTIRHCSSVARLSWPGSSYDARPPSSRQVSQSASAMTWVSYRQTMNACVRGQCDVWTVEHGGLDLLAAGDVTGIEVGSH